MGRKSEVEKLPEEIRELIGELRRNGRTLDEILEKLQELDCDVSRSSLGRWTKSIDAAGKDLQRSRAMAEALVKQFGEEPDSRVAHLNFQLMHSMVMKIVVSEEGVPVTLDPNEAMLVARTLRDLTAAQKSNMDQALQLRKEIAAEQKAKLADLEKSAKGKGGIDATTLERVREILGVA